MPVTFVLIHSPSVGPRTWLPVADELRRRGMAVAVPDLRNVTAEGPPFWQHVRDAALPAVTGSTPVAAPEVLTFLRGKVRDGLLPRWTDWWDEADVASMSPDPATREGIVAEQPRLPLEYYQEQVPAPAGWDRLPCAYLWFGPPYDQLAAEAEGRGWAVRRLPGEHLQPQSTPLALPTPSLPSAQPGNSGLSHGAGPRAPRRH